ncbi:MAG: (Fe-S)-binding protein [Methanomassiliicoccales archaeon]|nr:MAG: (Fe-S)-binding protein [Methanomassiliicoccales archaeon]
MVHGINGLDLWSCMTCGTCRTVCPEGVDFPGFMQALRKDRLNSTIPVRTHASIIDSIRSVQATGKGIGKRNDWTKEGLELDDRSEFALFVGCIPLLDIVFRDLKVDLTASLRSAVRILNKTGIRPKLIEGERCCGHDAYWLGDMDEFLRLAKANVDAISRSDVRNIITVCPECSHTLACIYPEVVGDVRYKVVHITEVIKKGIDEGNLAPDSLGLKFTYQDPCRLGRFMGIYDPPRAAISSIGELIEMPRSSEMSACCGSTCFVQCDHIVKKWQLGRLGEARRTGADMLLTSCPKCMIHLNCAQKDFGTYKDRPRIPIKDVAVAFSEALDDD